MQLIFSFSFQISSQRWNDFGDADRWADVVRAYSHFTFQFADKVCLCLFTFWEKDAAALFHCTYFLIYGSSSLERYKQHQTAGQHTAFYWLGFTVLLPLDIMISSLCDRVSSLISWLCCWRVFLRPPPAPRPTLSTLSTLSSAHTRSGRASDRGKLSVNLWRLVT